jgi:hypothetical protein
MRAEEKGFTLVEGMIAMLVSVVGMIALAGMFSIAIKSNAHSRNLTTATTFAQDKLEQLGAMSFQRLVDPAKMQPNPSSKGEHDVYVVGSLEEDTFTNDAYYYDKIILAGRDDVEPEGTITVVDPSGKSETRRPDGTVFAGNPFGENRVTYSRRWVILASNEEDPANRRLTVAVRVKSEVATSGKTPEQVDLYTVFTRQ